MSSLRRFAFAISPFVILGACSELIGLSDFEKGDVQEGEGGEETGGRGATSGKGGTSGSQSGGTSGASRGGTAGKGGQGGTGNTGPGGESGDAGMGGEPPEGGTGGTPGGKGGTAGRGGTAGAGMGGLGGAGGAGAGSGGAGSGGAGTGGAGMGGSGGSGGSACSTVTVALRSPGFDSDTSAWVQYDDGMGPPRPPIIVAASSEGISAHSVPNVANLIGRDDIYQEGQYQTVTIPTGAVTLTLSGYRQVITQEAGSTVYDRVRVQMYEDALYAVGYMGEFAVFTNVDENTGWLSFSGSVAVGTHAGQMVDLDMWAIADTSLITDIYLDSLTLTALVCP